MKNPFLTVITLTLGFFICVVSHAKVDVAEISHKWSGLILEGRQTSRITFALEAGNAAAKTVGNQLMRRGVQIDNRYAALQFGGGQPLKGSVTIEQAKFEGFGTPPAAHTTEVQGELLGDLNLIKLQYSNRMHGKVTLFGALTPDRSRLAVVYGGQIHQNSLPFFLVSGITLPENLQAFASSKSELDSARTQAEIQATSNEVNRQTLQIEMQRLQTEMQQAYATRDKEKIEAINKQMLELSQNAMKQIMDQAQPQIEQAQKMRAQQLEQQQKALVSTAGITQQMTALQQQMVQALQSGDTESAKRLQEELKALGLQRAAAISGRAFTPSPAMSSNSCSGGLLEWAAEMDSNGASAAQYSGMAQLANLFRPSVFNRHFDSDLLSMDDAQRRGFLYELRQSCTRQQHPFTRGSNISTVANGFSEDSHQINYISAAIAGETLDNIAQWLQSTLPELTNAGNADQLERLQGQAHYLLASLWPNETTSANDNITGAFNQTIVQQLTAEINSQASKANSGDFSDLIEFGNLRHHPNWSKLDTANRTLLDNHFSQKASPVLNRYFNRSFPADSKTGRSRQALTSGKQWYDLNARLFALFSNTDSVKTFTQNLIGQRENHYQNIFTELKNEIASLTNTASVKSFGREFNLAMDTQNSKTWQALNQEKTQRLIELNREAFVARVGAGPFKPEDPGAVYLNALYRSDNQTIYEEDQAFVQPLIKLMEPLNNSGIYELFAAFSGGMVDAEGLKQRMRSEMQNTSMSSTLAGFFVVAYEHIAPQCLGPNPIEFERTETWDEVVQNGLGMELSRTSHSHTTYYTIAQRHAQVFRKIGETTNAENLDFVNSLFGGFGLIPEDSREAIDTLSSNLRGLRIAMQKYPCDGEVLKTLEASLIKQAMSH